NSEASVSPPLSGNMSGVAPAGEIMGYSIATLRRSPASHATRYPPPPMPFIHGSATPTAKAVAIAASIALPPRFSLVRPASTASGALAATTPRLPVATGRVICHGVRLLVDMCAPCAAIPDPVLCVGGSIAQHRNGVQHRV